MNIIFYNTFSHNGDLLFTKSFLQQFCELNKDKFNIYLLLKYNSFLFSDIPNLNIILPSSDINYNNHFCGHQIDPLNYININNMLFIKYINIFCKNFTDVNFLVLNDTIYINTWIGFFDGKLISHLDCDLYNCNDYYNNIISNINNKYNLNISNINNLYLLPSIPYSNIDSFIKLKNNNKIIFYYNYYPNSIKIDINHDDNINYLANKFKNYIICCADKHNSLYPNVVSLYDYGYIKNILCDNISKAVYCAMYSDIVISFETGACFYHLNDKFNNIFKGKWFYISNKDFYYNRLNKYLNNDNFKHLNNIKDLNI